MKINTLRKVRSRGLTPVEYRSPTATRFGFVLKTGRKWVTLQFGAGDRTRITKDEFNRYARKL